MDKIYRKISLEQAKNRNINALPYYTLVEESGETHCVYEDKKQPWGCYTVDILIPITGNKCDSDEPCIPEITLIKEIHDTLGLTSVDVYDEETNCHRPMYWARYKNLMMIYYWVLNKFVPSLRYYRYCATGFVPVCRKGLTYFLENDIRIFPNLDTASESVELGEIIGITVNYDAAIKRFKEIDNIKGFIGFMNKLLKEGLFPPLSGTTPYIDLEFSINTDKLDLGIMSPVMEQWVPKKKYYLGNVVIFNNYSYYLGQCSNKDYDLVEIKGQLLESIMTLIDEGDTSYAYVNDLDNIPDDAFRITNYIHDFQMLNNSTKPINYTQYIYRDGNGHYFFIKPYYTGDFNDLTKVTSFDDNFFTHWRKIDLKDFLVVDDDKVYTGVTESKVISLKRQKTPVDDSGNQLLFFPQYDDSGYTISGDTEIQYLIGITNENMYSDGTWTGDDFVSISKVINVSGETYREEIEPNADGKITSDQFDELGAVEFVYYMGATLDVIINESGVTKTRIEKTGVKYTEQWNYEKKTVNFRIDGTSKDYTYILFYPVDNGNTYENNLDINGKTPIYSIIEYYDGQSKDFSVLLTSYYKDEDLIGVQDVNDLEYDYQSGRYYRAIDAYIERGKSASFERHNILGEVKTFADLENYRNNFFQI